MIKNKNTKKAYTISCTSSFRDKIDVLCRRKKVNTGDIARSVILTIDKDDIMNTPDPGDAPDNDREIYFKTTDKKKQKPLKRKPRIQVRLPDGYDITFIRKALNAALLLNSGEVDFNKKNKTDETKLIEKQEKLYDENERLKAIVYALMFDTIKTNIKNKEDCFYILGIPPSSNPNLKVIKQRFRMLATIYHPDNPLGSHERMSQLNEAFNFLKMNIFL